MLKVTPANLWLAHRAAAGGRSTITGAPLPETIEDCAEGPQSTHYAMACFIAQAHGEDAVQVPVPSKMSAERAEVLRKNAERSGRIAAGLAGAFGPLMDAVRES